MIKNCITENTKMMTIYVDSLPELNDENFEYYNELAKRMSAEMGVPKDLLINGRRFFFIDRWHKIDGKWYFFKSDGFDFHFINELLGEIISEYFGLGTAHYKVGKLIVEGKDPEIGVVSENFCSTDYKYTRIFDYKLAAGDIRYLEELRSICASDEEFKTFFADLKKFIIRDFYTSQGDRSGNNFLFKERKDGSEGKRLAELYDYENGYELYPRNFVMNPLVYQNMEKDFLRKYFKRDQEYQESLEKIRDANMLGFLTEVEERHGILIPKDLKDTYIKVDKRKKEIVSNNRLVKVLKPKHQRS
ncbi:MAG: hypothetical protein K2G03_04410 [Bacilli bacterium]|nr:hypothetical protein [Bacilli bacterium]